MTQTLKCIHLWLHLWVIILAVLELYTLASKGSWYVGRIYNIH